MATRVVVSFCLVLSLEGPAGNAAESPAIRRALILAVDGTRPDALLAANAPVLKSLFQDGAWSLDGWAATGPQDPPDATPDYPVSGSSYSSMLTGVWCSKHGVCENDFAGERYDLYPALDCRLEAARPDALVETIVRWQPLSPNLVLCAATDLAPSSDANATAEAVRLLRETDPDVLFFHQEDPDTAGHSCGFAPDAGGNFPACYIAAIETADARVGAVLEAMRARATYASEEWLVIACSDHGGIAKDHHNRDLASKRVFMVLHGPGVTPGEIVPPPFLVDVAPTVLAYLGVSIDPAWDLDGQVVALASDPPPVVRRPGDCSGDGTLDISDAICVLRLLFLGEASLLPCASPDDQSALLDGNGDGSLDVSDGIYVLVHLFGGGPGHALGSACVPVGTCPEACSG